MNTIEIGSYVVEGSQRGKRNKDHSNTPPNKGLGVGKRDSWTQLFSLVNQEGGGNLERT